MPCLIWLPARTIADREMMMFIEDECICIRHRPTPHIYHDCVSPPCPTLPCAACSSNAVSAPRPRFHVNSTFNRSSGIPTHCRLSASSSIRSGHATRCDYFATAPSLRAAPAMSTSLGHVVRSNRMD